MRREPSQRTTAAAAAIFCLRNRFSSQFQKGVGRKGIMATVLIQGKVQTRSDRKSPIWNEKKSKKARRRTGVHGIKKRKTPPTSSIHVDQVMNMRKRGNSRR